MENYMQKSSFINSILIATTVIAMPIRGMELASDATKTPITINVELHLTKQRRILNRYDERDKHSCEVLGIKWEDNNNTYTVENALFKNPGKTNDRCWTEKVPKNLPKSIIPNSRYSFPNCQDLPYTVNQFPYTLPKTFVERLKQETSITLTDTLFTQPVEIILHLKPIENDSNNEQLTLNTPKVVNDLLKEFPSTPTEILQSSENNNNKSTATSTPKATPNFKIYIIPGIAVTGLFAWLIYLHKNNQLDFSQITNFMHSLTSKK